jgi:hypothetical protein
MVTEEQMRALALSMPEAEEKSHFGQADFRVRNKIFCGLSSDGLVGNLKLTADAQSLVLEAKPETFYPAAGAWGRSGWTHVRLERADLAELRVLIDEAWRLIAPKRLAASHPVTRAPAKAAAKKAPARPKRD